MIVAVRRRAVRQVDSIARRIAEDRPGVAIAFISAFDDLTDRLRDHPLSAPMLREPDLRQATMTRFPYVVVYRAAPGRVTVLGVFHAARHPSVRTRP